MSSGQPKDAHGELRKNATTLRNTRSRLTRVERVAESIGPHVGHGGPAGMVRDFGCKRDITRGTLEQQLQLLADSLDAIAETFNDLDRDLGDQARSVGDS